MKKIFIIVLVLSMSLGIKAQIGFTDAFFNDWQQSDLMRDMALLPTLPGSHGLEDDFTAPLGSGLIILSALGAGYATLRRRKE